MSPRWRAILQALLVTFLWATSWVLIKIGLQSGALPPLTFAGLRYGLAFVCLLPIALRPAGRTALRAMPRTDWWRLLALGLVFYTVTQGAQFVALKYLPAITVNLLLSFSTVVVALLGVGLLAERPTAPQWGGMAIALAGALVFFYPAALAPGQSIGYIAAGAGVLANAVSSVLGRRVNRAATLAPLVVTTVSMGAGSAVLLTVGLVLQGLPRLSWLEWGLVLWLAVINTAFAFTLWNGALRTLSAIESSVINGLLIIQIPVLAWLFLGEPLSTRKILGLALAGGGALIVQLRARPARAARAAPTEQGAYAAQIE